MTADEYRAALSELDMTLVDAAELFGISYRQMRRFGATPHRRKAAATPRAYPVPRVVALALPPNDCEKRSAWKRHGKW